MAFGCLRYAHIARSEPRRLTAAFLHADAPRANKSMLATGSILQCQHASPTASFGPKKSWRPIERWRQHDKGSPGCASPTRGVHGPSWRCRRPCRVRWPSCWTTRRRSPRTPGVAWHQHWPNCWSVARRRWPPWETGRTRATSRMWAKWHSTTRQRSMRPRSRSSLCMVWGAASELTDQLSCEAIPQAELDKARSHGLAEAERVVRQDRQPIWASSQKFQDVRKRLKLSQQFVEAAEKARQEGDTVASPLMPDQLNGKVLTATLKNGRAICPEFQTDECPNPADACPFGVHLCTILQKSGRACGGKHGAGVCNIKRAVMAASSVPAAPKPSATLVPAALGDRAKFTRKRTAAAPAEGATDDDVADVMRAAVKGQRSGSSQDTPQSQVCGSTKDASKGNAPSPIGSIQSCTGQTSDQSYAKEGAWEESRRQPRPTSRTPGSWIRHRSSPHLHLDIKEGRQALLSRAPDAADSGQVPQDSAADLLLPEFIKKIPYHGSVRVWIGRVSMLYV